MRKKKRYPYTRFSPEVIKTSLEVLSNLAASKNESIRYKSLNVEHDDSEWSHDSIDEFFADYRKYNIYSLLEITFDTFGVSVTTMPYRTDIQIKAPARDQIESMFSAFEAAKDASRVPEPSTSKIHPTIFIGHGQSTQWRDLKDHLTDKHGCRVEAYETGARAGHTIRDVLEELVKKTSFAILVFTAEDEQADGNWRARQNVVHEAGLFQGRLGFARAIMLVEDGVEQFSNVAGIQYIRFTKSNIRETYGEVLATLRREFAGDA